MSILYLVRHGQSEWNRAGRIQGRSESPLTDAGRAQAAALGRLLRETLRDRDYEIVASPLRRAYETATIIASHLGHPASAVRAESLINDFDVGMLAGYPGWEAVAAAHPELARLRLRDPLRFHPPRGESGAEVLARVRAFLAERDASAKETLVVCHGVINKFIRAARCGVAGTGIIALGEAQDVVYRMDGTSVTELRAGAEAQHG